MRRGQRVRVELPDERARDRARSARSAAWRDERRGAGAPTRADVDVTVGAGRAPGALDEAPVDGHVTTERGREDALAVPVHALLALAGGGYGVEVVADGATASSSASSPGSFADGYVQVEGEGVEAERVVVVVAAVNAVLRLARRRARRYGGSGDVLRDVDLDVERGRAASRIVGPSGSGKSTLLHVDRHARPAERGRGRGRGPRRRRRCPTASCRRCGRAASASSSSSSTCSTALPAIDNVGRPGCSTAACPPRERRRRRARGARRASGSGTGSTHRPTSSPAASASGWRSPGRSSARPAFVLADEPTGNLDSRSGGEIVDLLRELHAEGTTVVVITHDRELAGSLPRRIELRDGAIVADAQAAAA